MTAKSVKRLNSAILWTCFAIFGLFSIGPFLEIFLPTPLGPW